MTTLYVFTVFFGVAFVALILAWLMLTLIGVVGTVIIVGGALLFGSGAAIIEYLTTERSE